MVDYMNLTVGEAQVKRDTEHAMEDRVYDAEQEVVAAIEQRDGLLEACKVLIEGGECSCENIDADAWEDGERCAICIGQAAIAGKEPTDG